MGKRSPTGESCWKLCEPAVHRSIHLAFQERKSYLIIVVMMGMALRHSPIPKPYLAAVYLGIGGGLLLASLGYFRRL